MWQWAKGTVLTLSVDGHCYIPNIYIILSTNIHVDGKEHGELLEG
jgi:hypothetical protein